MSFVECENMGVYVGARKGKKEGRGGGSSCTNVEVMKGVEGESGGGSVCK